MKCLRHLSAVVLAVAVIVGLGMLWVHASGGGTGIGNGPRQAPSREAPRLARINTGVIRDPSANGFQLANTGDLTRTCVIEAALAVVVITASALRRRHRRTRLRAERAPGAGTVPATASASAAPRPHPPTRSQEAACPMPGARPGP